MSKNDAVGLFGIHAAAKLPPEDVRACKGLLERDHTACVRCNQAQANVSLIGRGGQVIGEFFEESQMREFQILCIINDEALDSARCQDLYEPATAKSPGHGENNPESR